MGGIKVVGGCVPTPGVNAILTGLKPADPPWVKYFVISSGGAEQKQEGCPGVLGSHWVFCLPIYAVKQAAASY